MSIAEDLKPFEKELNLYKSHNALPQGEVKGALADIYEKYYPQNRHWGVSKPNRSCPSCVSDFMKCLVAEWNNRPTVEFKGVPQKAETKNKKDMKVIAKDFNNEPVEIVERLSKELEHEGTLEEKVDNLNFLADQPQLE